MIQDQYLFPNATAVAGSSLLGHPLHHIDQCGFRSFQRQLFKNFESFESETRCIIRNVTLWLDNFIKNYM